MPEPRETTLSVSPREPSGEELRAEAVGAARGRAEHEPTVEELQADVEEARGRLLSSAQRVQADLERATAWLAPVRKHPWLFLAGAFATGLLIAALIPSDGADDE